MPWYRIPDYYRNVSCVSAAFTEYQGETYETHETGSIRVLIGVPDGQERVPQVIGCRRIGIGRQAVRGQPPVSRQRHEIGQEPSALACPLRAATHRPHPFDRLYSSGRLKPQRFAEQT
jgi:hypothetical protein